MCKRVEGGQQLTHAFATLIEPVANYDTLVTRQILDVAIREPVCRVPGHAGRRVTLNGSYTTQAGRVQRYQCGNRDLRERHTFAAVIPRSAVNDDTFCRDCDVPTPRNAGMEATTRCSSYPASVIYSVLRSLADGRAYTHASMKALEEMKRPTARSRRIRDKVTHELIPVETLNQTRGFSPDREQKAHWHIAADILERFAPIVTEPAFADIVKKEAEYRERGLPVVYFADEVPVKRDFARSNVQTSSPVVWTALVVARTQWAWDDDGTPNSRSSRLVRFRAMPTCTTEAWTLVLSELQAPDFLIADGATAIANAAKAVWGTATTIVPCTYHAVANIEANLTPKKAKLPEKVQAWMFALTREWMASDGPAAVTEWFNELQELAEAASLPLDVLTSQRALYEPLLKRAAVVAQEQTNPEVQISNAIVENQIHEWVKKVTSYRGPMYANLPRTNLLGDLVVAGSNGALLDRHDVIHAIRDATCDRNGWAPPPRALVEPAGAASLRDAFSIAALIAQPGEPS